jgi:V8-like Glu-specific endopeptidase
MKMQAICLSLWIAGSFFLVRFTPAFTDTPEAGQAEQIQETVLPSTLTIGELAYLTVSQPFVTDISRLSVLQNASPTSSATLGQTSEAQGLMDSQDDRVRVSPTTNPPWRAIVSLEITFPNAVLACSGFLIGPNLVATAGHCVYNHSLGGWSQAVKVIPGRDAVEEPYGAQMAINGFTHRRWIEEQDEQLDFGAVQLPDSTFADTVGWFRYGAFRDTDLAPGLITNLAGYPITETVPFDCPQENPQLDSCQLWFGTATTNAAHWEEVRECMGLECTVLAKGILGYPIDVSDGQEGAPVWAYNGSQQVVMGIHTAKQDESRCTMNVGSMNCGTLITSSVADLFEYWGAVVPLPILLGPFQAERPQPPAIMLVHGWRGNCLLDSQKGTFAALPDFIAQEMVKKRIVVASDAATALNTARQRIKLFCASGKDHYEWRRGVVKNAELLKNEVEQFRTQLGLADTHKVILVAHSFGGLVARRYIEKLKGADRVSRLIMLGTPNLGVSPLSLAPPLCFSLFGLTCFKDKALLDMVPTNVNRLLNKGFVPPSTKYRVIIGTGGNRILPLNRVIGNPNDCIVNVASARGLDFPTLERVNIIHAVTPPGGCRERMHYFTDSDTNTIVREAIFEGGGGFTANIAGSNDVAQNDGVNDLLERASALNFGNIALGGTNTLSTVIESNLPGISFILAWVATETFSPTLRLTLEDPNGIVVDTTPGVQHGTSMGPEFGDLMFDLYSIESPLAGVWTLHIQGVNVPSEGHPYALAVLPDSSITFTVDLDSDSYIIGQNIRVTASLWANGVPVTNTMVTATVTLPDGGKTGLDFHDDGLNGDIASGDGWFSAKFASGHCGFHMFEVNGSATIGSGPIVRKQLAYTTVHVPGSTFDEPCTAHAIYLPLVIKE